MIVQNYMAELILKAKKYKILRKCNFSQAISLYLVEPDKIENITNDFGGVF